MESLRTPSVLYSHGGYYGPANPNHCDAPGGPCMTCQEKIDYHKTDGPSDPYTCSLNGKGPCFNCQQRMVARPTFMEPCPTCNSSCYTTHDASGCMGCADKICLTCHYGRRYTCTLLRPEGLERQQALGIPTDHPPTEACKFCDCLDIRYPEFEAQYRMFGYVCSDCAPHVSAK